MTISLQEIGGPLADFISVKQGVPRCGIPFLNLNFSGKGTPIPGSGVYGLFSLPASGGERAGRLIYVGKYRGKKTQPLAGHVARARWWTHVASITMRGHKVSIAQSTIATLVDLLRSEAASPFHALTDPLLSENLRKDSGCGSGLNRVLFARENWARFAIASGEDLLAALYMIYIRLTEVPKGMSVSTFRDKIGSIERSLIAELRPICNAETVWGTARDDVTSDEFAESARARLRGTFDITD